MNSKTPITRTLRTLKEDGKLDTTRLLTLILDSMSLQSLDCVLMQVSVLGSQSRGFFLDEPKTVVCVKVRQHVKAGPSAPRLLASCTPTSTSVPTLS